MKTKQLLVMAVAAAFILSGLVVSHGAAAEAKPAAKFGYVDLIKVFDSYSKTKESEQILQDKEKAKTDERKKMVDEIRKLKDELDLLSDKAKADKQKVVDEKIKKIQEFDMTTREELAKERDDKLKEILEKIDKVVGEYAKKEGYTVIFNSRFLLYAEQSIDLTDKVIELVNASK